jgi:protein transport protein SEC24
LSRYYSKGVPRNYDAELELAGVDEESTFLGTFVYDGGVQEDEGMYVQLAILYTDNRRRRLVRVHNLCLRASSNHTRIFRGADLDAVAYAMVTQAAERAFTKPLSADRGPRDHIKITACDMLYSYRLYCSSHSPRGQLILPDSLKLLPLYCLGILKHPAFIDNMDLRGKTSFEGTNVPTSCVGYGRVR